MGPGVLIPRPETEVVAGRAIELLPRDGVAIDVGTGSGAIAIALATERPDASVLATEVSAAALSWARRNAESIGAPVRFFEGDLFDPLPPEFGGRVDVVVSNPPYIATAEAALLPSDVRDHEPHEALFAGTDGLAVIRRLIAEAPKWLRSGGMLVLEIAPHQERDVLELLVAAGYRDPRVAADLTGRPRVAEGRVA